MNQIAMTKYVFISFLLLFFIPKQASAQLGGDGYYRVQNAATKRYIGIIHNTSKSEIITTQADLEAMRAYKDWSWVESDPATIIYFKKKGTTVTNGKLYTKYNMYGQGTNTYDIIQHDLNVISVGSNYRCVVEYSGTQSLSERDASSSSTVNKLEINNEKTWNWSVKPVSSTGDCYFGLKPTVDADGKYYGTIYADFGFTPVSSSTKAYYVHAIFDGHVVLREIEGEVPAATPLIFECMSSQASDNKVDIALNSATLPSKNQLSGVYFCIDNGQSYHKQFVDYNPNTMRVLGKCSDGKPGFVKKSVSDFQIIPDFWDYMAEGAIPANTAYLVVPEGTPDELHFMSYEEYLIAGIDGVETDNVTSGSIRSLSGVTVSKNATSTDGLSKGVYIWNNKKVVVR